MVMYVDDLKKAEEICEKLGSPCIICNYEWCDIGVEGFKGIYVVNARKSLVDEVMERMELYSIFKSFIRRLATNLHLSYDLDVLASIVGNFQSYGYPKCVCKDTVCPCYELILVAQGVRNRCSCGLFSR